MEDELKMPQPLFDRVFNLVKHGNLDNIRFIPYHKGMDIYINGNLNENEEEELKDEIEEWYYENFEIGLEIQFFINKQILNAIVCETISWGFIGDNLIRVTLIEPADIATFLNIEEEEIDINDVDLQFSGTVSHEGIEVDEYSLEYSGELGTVSLTEYEELKKKLLDRIQEACDDGRFFKDNQFECYISGASNDSINISSESGKHREVTIIADNKS